jgi:hypothetical protein
MNKVTKKKSRSPVIKSNQSILIVEGFHIKSQEAMPPKEAT